MTSLLKARLAFTIAIGLLLACALVVYGTLFNFTLSERQVHRTQHVQVLLGDTESAIASAARARLTYVFNGDDQSLAQYQQAVARIPSLLAELRESTADNPVQQGNCDRLQRLVANRTALWEKSIALRQSGAPAPPGQPDMTRQSVTFADEIISVTQDMRAEETRLLQGRRVSAGVTFFFVIVILITSFLAAVLLLFWHYRLVREELLAREQAEQATLEAARAATEAEQKARQSEAVAIASSEATRRLSAHLMQLQDEERRKFARELHDSTGQQLAAVKMVLASLAVGHENDRRYSDCVNLVDQSLKEIRTISHLLHPSGLDEAGFPAAAKWYAEEFAKRSGIQFELDIAEPVERLPRETEIALFRVLQESLTNIHRHSKSSSAGVIFQTGSQQATLTIKDQGVGISREVLERFHSSGTSGVGLAGMRERVRELGGRFEVTSGSAGTSVRVTVPVPGQRAWAAGDPRSAAQKGA
jgi:signal transduction histidine kinase